MESTIEKLQRRFLSVRDFAAAYGISRSLAYKLMAEGRLSFVKVGSRRLIPLECAEAWAASLAAEAA